MSNCTCYLTKGKYCSQCNPRLSVEYLCGQLKDLRIKNAELIRAAQAVIDRWDSPNWKDGTHTAEYIHALRQAVDSVKL